MKKIAVTGGAGFLGSWLCQRLVAAGDYVVSFDLKMPEFGFAPAQEYNIFDLRNPVEYFSEFRWQDFDQCYMLAANMGGAEFVFSGKYDAEIMQQSATINLHTLEACRKFGVNQVLFTSSACVYPSLGKEAAKDGIACKESFAGNPDSAYGDEKLFTEKLCDAYARNFGMDIKVARVHNAFGEYGTWRGGREKSPAALCRKIAEVGDRGVIEVFGTGEQTRSFIHASEAVEGFYRLMQSDFRGPVNVGSSEMVTINHLVQIISDIAGKPVATRHVPGPIGVQGRNSDNSLIFEKLGWKPSMSLKEGLERTYPWIAEQVAKAKALTSATL